MSRLAACAVLAAAALFVAPAGAQTPPPAATPTPGPALTRFTGQLLDVRGGYVYFTTGDAFRLVASPRITDYDTGGPTTLQPRARIFARATLDPATRSVTELALTRRVLPTDRGYGAIKPFSTAVSTPQAAAELAPKPPVTGREVAVVFDITVPPSTGIADNVYISTDASGWDPKAIRADRVDGAHYRVARRFGSGAKFAYRVTRGSWQSVEIGQNGIELAPHQFVVQETDAQVARTNVAAWSDARGGGGSAQQSQAQPGAIPTPFNANPFPPGLFPPGAIKPGGGATPPPNRPPNPH